MTKTAHEAPPRRRIRVSSLALRRYARTAPLSLALAVVLFAMSLETGTLIVSASDPSQFDTTAYWAVGVTTTVLAGSWWTVLTAMFVPWDIFQTLFGVIASLALIGIAERLLGTRRVLISFLASGIVGFGLGVVLQRAGAQVGEWWADATSFDTTLDPLTPIVGAFMASTAFMSGLWRRRARVLTFALIVMFALYDGDSSNVYRLIAAVTGVLIGVYLHHDRLAPRRLRSSVTEARTLLGTVVAVTAIGPVVTVATGAEFGPFYYLGHVFQAPDAADVLSRCANDLSAACDRDLALVSSAGLGSVLLTFVPLILLLIAAYGLARGRRLALWLAIGVDLALAGLAFFSLDFVSTLSLFDQAGEYLLWAAAAVLVPLLVAIALAANARLFRVRAPRGSVQRWGSAVLAAFVLLGGLYLAVALANADTFVPAADPPALIADTFRRFLPVSFLGATGTLYVPDDDLTFFLFQSVGPVFWLVVAIAVIALFRATVVARRTGDLARVRALLHRGGGGTLGYMGTWPGNAHWFSADGSAAVSYRVINGIAITLSDPICLDGDGPAVIRDFAAFCEESGWVPVFYSVHESFLPAFDEMGWQYTPVGEETLMHPVTLDMAGGQWKRVRQALSRGTKAGLTTEWTTWDALPAALANQISTISEQWVAEKEMPEMGFTLGTLEELKDPEVALFLALGPDGRLQAITSWLPSYRNGRPVGWTMDFMRRADDSMPGVMEFVIASAALQMQKDGVEILSLSGAPLATAPLEPGESPPPPTVMTRLLEFLARTLEPAYGFSSLFRFKSKFNPSYSTVYMAYRDPLALPSIGAAIAKAYLPDVSPKEAVSLLRTLTGAGRGGGDSA